MGRVYDYDSDPSLTDDLVGVQIFVIEDIGVTPMNMVACMDYVDGTGFYNCDGPVGNALMLLKRNTLIENYDSGFTVCSIEVYPGMRLINKALETYEGFPSASYCTTFDYSPISDARVHPMRLEGNRCIAKNVFTTVTDATEDQLAA